MLFLGPDGLVDSVRSDSSVDIEAVAHEYAMLLRIAGRTAEDTGAGKIVEHMMVADKSVAIARLISPENFVVVIFRSTDQIGRARYELKKSAWELGQDLP